MLMMGIVITVTIQGEGRGEHIAIVVFVGVVGLPGLGLAHVGAQGATVIRLLVLACSLFFPRNRCFPLSAFLTWTASC